MKKIVSMFVAMVVFGSFAVPAMAAQKGSAEYQRLVELKKAQREQRSRERANPSARAKGFWEREAERSGLAGTGAMFRNAAASVNPIEKLDAATQKNTAK